MPRRPGDDVLAAISDVLLQAGDVPVPQLAERLAAAVVPQVVVELLRAAPIHAVTFRGVLGPLNPTLVATRGEAEALAGTWRPLRPGMTIATTYALIPTEGVPQ